MHNSNKGAEALTAKRKSTPTAAADDEVQRGSGLLADDGVVWVAGDTEVSATPRTPVCILYREWCPARWHLKCEEHEESQIHLHSNFVKRWMKLRAE